MDPAKLSEPISYNGVAGFPKPRRMLWRSRFFKARPMRRFAPRMTFNPMLDAADPELVAHWGEVMQFEDLVTVLHRDGTISTLYHVVTQLHGAAQLAAWDEVVRSCDLRRELTRIGKARLFVPEGRWVDADRHTQTVSAPGGRANNDGRTTVVRFAPLRPGVIVEFEEAYDSFRVDDFGPSLANNFFLRTAAPCRRRRYTVAVARPFRLTYRMHHSDVQPVERQEKDYHVCSWEVQDADGVEFDDWTPPIRDFGPWIDVTTAEAWTPFAKRLRSELESWSTVGNDVKTVACDLSRDKATPLEKAAAAYTYVAGAVRYGRPPHELQTRNSRAAEQMMRDLRGDCKDKSALLVQLLRTMKIKANVAAVMTGDAGRTPFLPSARFNHAIVRMEHEGEIYWLDAASGPFAFGELPAVDQGIHALVLDRDAYRFELIRPFDGEFLHEARECIGRLTAEGDYEFSITTRLAGEAGARLRMQLAARTEKHRLHVLQSWLGNDFPGAAGSQFKYVSVDDLGKSFEFTCQARMDRVARRIKDLALFRVPWSGRVSMAGPMSAAERSQPLVVPLSFHTTEQHTIELPAGISTYAVPDPVALECAWGRYECRTIDAEGRLVCERRLQLAGSAAPPERFKEFQDFWRQCSWSDSAEIVLRREVEST